MAAGDRNWRTGTIRRYGGYPWAMVRLLAFFGALVVWSILNVALSAMGLTLWAHVPVAVAAGALLGVLSIRFVHAPYPEKAARK
jgi:hypothetical protein